jgi:hypothetical protein
MHRIVPVLLSLLAVGCAHKVRPTVPAFPNRFDSVTFTEDLGKFNNAYVQWSRDYFGCPPKAREYTECYPDAGVKDLKGYKAMTDLVIKVFPVRKEK